MTTPAPVNRLRPRRSCLAVPGSNPRFLEKAQGLPGRPGLPGPGGRVRAARQARGAAHHRQVPQRGRLDGQDTGRARQRLDDRVDVPRCRHGRRGRGAEPRLHHAAEGAGRPTGRGAGPVADADREDDGLRGRQDRHRGADRERAGAQQRQRDRAGLAARRDDHLRSRRLHGVDQHEVPRRGRAAARVPGGRLPLHPDEDPDGRPRQQPPGDRRPLPPDPQRRRLPRGRPACRRARLRRQVGAAPRPGRGVQRDLLAVPRGLRLRRVDPRRVRLLHVRGGRQEGLRDARRRDDRRGQPQDGARHLGQGRAAGMRRTSTFEAPEA